MSILRYPSAEGYPDEDVFPGGEVPEVDLAEPTPGGGNVSARLERMLDTIPNYYRDDPHALTYLNSMALELDRLEAFMLAIQRAVIVGNPEDLYGLLVIWENMLALPMDPVGQSTLARSRRVAAYRRRKQSAGSEWEQAITDAIGSTSWSYYEVPDEGRVVVTLPYASGDPQAAIIEAFIRRITPAHLLLGAGYEGGFVLGVSRLGEEAL